MKNKKLLSLLLCIMMLVTFIPTQVFASGNENLPKKKDFIEGTQVGNKLVFKVFEVKNESKRRQRRSLVEEEPLENLDGLDISDNLHGEPVASAQTITQKVKVSLDAKGLNYSDNMSSGLLTSGLSIKIFFKATGQANPTVVSKEITVQKTGSVEETLDIPTGITAGVLYAEIQNPDDNVNIRLVKGADSTVETQVDPDSTWDFTFEVMEIVHPVIKLVTKDPYGQEIQVTDNLNVKFKNGSLEVPFNLNAVNSSCNIKNDAMFGEGGEGDINELNAYDSSNQPTLEVTGEQDGKVTLGGLDYKVKKEYNYTTGGTITLTSQPDAIVPPTKPGSNEPADIPTDNSYVRLTFDANEKVDSGNTGITGKHTAGTYAGQQKSYIDVKKGTKYDNAKLQELVKALKVKGDNNEAQNTTDPWTPKVSTENTKDVTEATYNAKYIKTADKVKALGGLKGVDFGAWKGTSTAGKFWNKGIAPADSITDAANKKTVQDAIDAATVTDTSTPARTTDTTGEKPGTLKVTFADGSVYVVDASKQDTDPAKTNIEQTLYVKDHVLPTSETNVPTDAIVVKLRLGEGVKAEYVDPNTHQVTESINGNKDNPVEHRTYKVKPGTDLSTYKLSSLNATVFELIPLKTLPNYKSATWKPADKVVTNQNNVFTASAAPKGRPAAPNVDEITEGDDKIKVKTPDDGDTIIIEIPDPTPQEPNNKKIITVEKDGDKWKTGDTEIREERGKLIIPVDPKDITRGKDIDVTVKDKTTNNVSDPTRKTVRSKIGPTILTLDENYRGGRISDYDVLVGEPIDAYLYTPHRRGYVFKGWSYNSRYLDEVRHGDRVYYPTTLYAIWSKQRAKDEDEAEIVDTREVGEHKAYMFGYPDGTVRPNGKITRAEAAALITRLLGIDTLGSALKPNFPDVPSGWYNKAINAAVQRGIMKGYPDGTFRPNAPITRAEFTQMIWTIDNKPYGVAPFADVVGHWAERPIGSEYQAGRIMGYPDGTFRPDAFITRAEAVVILNKIFDRNYDAMSAINCPTKSNIKFFIDLDASFWGYYDMVEATNTHSFKRRVKGSVAEDWTEVK